jgi:hypothetical protein
MPARPPGHPRRRSSTRRDDHHGTGASAAEVVIMTPHLVPMSDEERGIAVAALARLLIDLASHIRPGNSSAEHNPQSGPSSTPPR